MDNQLKKLAKNVKNMEQFITAITKFPRFYLRTPEQLRMTKKDLREFYQKTTDEAK